MAKVNSVLANWVLLLALVPSAALAQSGFTSAYTDLDLDQCLVLEADDFGVSIGGPDVTVEVPVAPTKPGGAPVEPCADSQAI